MAIQIEVLKGAGGVRFGMTPEQARKAIGASFTSFKRTSSSELPCDYFEALGIFVYYKLPGLVEAIEFATPSEPLLDGKNLLGLTFEQLETLLRSKDSAIEVEPNSMTSYKLGIGAYLPDAEESISTSSESIIVFEEGYYD